jgi:hypothetical protein
VTLSLKKIPGLSAETPPLRQVDLLNSTIVCENEKAESFDLEQWPVMLFLKGLGFENVSFQPQASTVIGPWAHRLGTYQTAYLFDPENFRKEECQWNEVDDVNGALLIECVEPSKKNRREELRSHFTVPPLEAPLALDTELVKKFRDEVYNQSPQETLLRVHSILKEYDKDSKKKSPMIWTALVTDIISIALEARLLEKAIELSENHQAALKDIWSPGNTRVVRLFSAYDPKGAELFAWSRIFTTLSNAQLVDFFESYLSTPAGAQMIKLMNYRIQNQSDEMVEICFKCSEGVQRLLLQWLSPHWREKHYLQLFSFVEKSVDNEDMFRLWLSALLRSSQSRALSDLENFFPKPRLLSRQKINVAFQKMVLGLFMEQPSGEILHFIRKIKSRLGGKLADQAEKILSSHHKGS